MKITYLDICHVIFCIVIISMGIFVIIKTEQKIFSNMENFCNNHPDGIYTLNIYENPDTKQMEWDSGQEYKCLNHSVEKMEGI